MKGKLIFIIGICYVMGCGPRKTDVDTKLLKPKEFAAKLKADSEIVLIDVRSSEEMSSGYIEGARHLDYNSAGFSQSLDSLDHSKTYFVYCASGKRSGRAVKMMSEKGFQHAVALDGGLLYWNANGLPTMKP
jgi:rhodanese-related sulfurtransferase